jgi:hypothetical protein
MNADRILMKVTAMTRALNGFPPNADLAEYDHQRLVSRTDSILRLTQGAWAAGIAEEMDAARQALIDARWRALGV